MRSDIYMKVAEVDKDETGHEPGRKGNLKTYKELIVGTVFLIDLEF
jgi:hypothetical protein